MAEHQHSCSTHYHAHAKCDCILSLAASPQAPSGQQAEPTDAMVKALEDCLFHLEADMGKFHPVCVQAREALARHPSERPCTHPPGCTHCNWCGFHLGQQSERPAPAGQAVGADEIHLAWRGALKACGVSEADRDAISQVVRDMLASQAERTAGREAK